MDYSELILFILRTHRLSGFCELKAEQIIESPKFDVNELVKMFTRQQHEWPLWRSQLFDHFMHADQQF